MSTDDTTHEPAPTPARCALCGQPFDPDEAQLVLMRDGRPVALYHERCHPHHRRKGCAGC